MMFSIITPSLNRPSLAQCCQSVEAQNFHDYEHLVAFDGIPDAPRAHARDSERRRLFTFKHTGAWGNYQRHAAWKYATGDYVIYLDDDNVLTPGALGEIATRLELAGNPAWAIFPILRHGSVFLHDPPGSCMTDTLNMVIRRDLARWPNTEVREADGIMADSLREKYKYAAFPDCAPIGVMERSGDGK